MSSSASFQPGWGSVFSSLIPSDMPRNTTIKGSLFVIGAAITACALKKIWNSAFKSSSVLETKFWEKVEKTPTTMIEPIVINKQLIYSTLKKGKLEMALASKHSSEFVKDHLINSDSPGTVLDLGCGIGTNSIPLLQKEWTVIAIDNQLEVVDKFAENAFKLEKKFNLTLLEEDITTYEHSEKVSAVICVDVLPYIPPTKLQATMKKIFDVLNPGGKFVGTLFFASANEKTPALELLGKLGAHFYPDQDFIREIITRSGFVIIEDCEREQYRIEFLAEKPRDFA